MASVFKFHLVEPGLQGKGRALNLTSYRESSCSLAVLALLDVLWQEPDKLAPAYNLGYSARVISNLQAWLDLDEFATDFYGEHLLELCVERGHYPAVLWADAPRGPDLSEQELPIRWEHQQALLGLSKLLWGGTIKGCLTSGDCLDIAQALTLLGPVFERYTDRSKNAELCLDQMRFFQQAVTLGARVVVEASGL